ncbi:MAG: hypothetical protein ABIH23_32240 [bacterium]
MPEPTVAEPTIPMPTIDISKLVTPDTPAATPAAGPVQPQNVQPQPPGSVPATTAATPKDHGLGLAEPPATHADGDTYSDKYGIKYQSEGGKWAAKEYPPYLVQEARDTDGNVLVEGGERTSVEIQEAFRDHQNVRNFIKHNQELSMELNKQIKAVKPLLDGLRPFAETGLDEKGNVREGSELADVMEVIEAKYGREKAATLLKLMSYKPAEFQDPLETEVQNLRSQLETIENERFTDAQFKKLQTKYRLDDAELGKVKTHWLLHYRQTGLVITPELAYKDMNFGKEPKSSAAMPPPANQAPPPMPPAAGPGMAAQVPKPAENWEDAEDQIRKNIDLSKLVT